jgi:hypothetical protein
MLMEQYGFWILPTQMYICFPPAPKKKDFGADLIQKLAKLAKFL